MKCTQIGSNHFFIEHEGNKYCFSYGENVASIIGGVYIEYDGDKYYSASSRRHKAEFRRKYNVEVKK